MKWIGQSIIDFIARFRSDVYLENISSGTIASGGNLGLDSDNKIVKAAEATGDITSVTITTDSGGGSAASDTAGSADFSILGANGVGVTNSGTTITAAAVPGEIDHDSLLNFASNEHFTQANITTVGTISTGVWNGTAIASAYLDADTAHLSGAQTIGGVKTIDEDVKLQFRDANAYINSPEANDIEIAATDITLDAAGTIKLEGPTRSTGQIHMTHHNFSDDIDTTKHYIGLARGDSENTATSQIHTPLIFPTAAKLLKLYLRANQNLSAKTLTFTLETQATGVGFGTGPTIVGTQSGAGCTNSSIVTYDFTTGLDSGDNIVDAGDCAYLGIQSSASTSTTKFYITCIWEVDFSSI